MIAAEHCRHKTNFSLGAEHLGGDGVVMILNLFSLKPKRRELVYKSTKDE